MSTREGDPDLQAGALVFLLLRRPTDWIHRRVESIRFIDDRTVERRVSIDFTLPPWATVPWVPLALLRKEKLRSFDLRSANNESVPVLTRHQNGSVAFNALKAEAETAIGGAVPQDIQRELEVISTGSSGPANAAYTRLRTGSTAAHRSLAGSRALVAFANLLVGNFILLAAVDSPPGVRAILKFCYEETLPEREESFMNALTWLGWRRFPIDFAAPAVADSSSYHFEIEAPQDVDISAASLRAEHTEFGSSTDLDGGERKRVHLYLSDVPYGSAGKVSVLLRAQRAGFLRAALTTTVLTAGLLIACRIALGSIADDFGPAVTLLLVVPALLAAYLVRPGEHALVTTLLRGVRMMVLVSGSCAVAAAAILVAGVEGAWLCVTWTVLAAIAGICCLGVVLSNLLPRPIEP
jgi:hypothetical protein